MTSAVTATEAPPTAATIAKPPKQKTSKAKPKASKSKGPKPTKKADSKKESKPVECDPSKLTAREAQGRCGELYRLQRAVEDARKREDSAKSLATAATEARKKAEVALDEELRDQRTGQGNLFS